MAKRLWFKLAAALVLAWAGVLVSAQAAEWNYRVGETAPSFALKTLDGKDLAAADLRGHYAVVSFMTTWCPFCNAAAPYLDEIGRKYGDRGVKVLIVDINEEPETVAKFVDKHKLSCPVLMDSDRSVVLSYAPPKDFVPDLARDEVMIASFVIIDPKGTIQFLSLNEDPVNFDAKLGKLRKRLDQLLAQH